MARKPRFVVRVTNTKIIVQLIQFNIKGDQVLASADSSALAKLGWKYSCKNIPAAYLTGLLLGKKALGLGCTEAVLDTGFKGETKKSKIYAVMKGALDAGLNIPSGEGIFPDPERLQGKHIQSYAQHLKTQPNKYQQHFAQYLKIAATPESIDKEFQQLKSRIMH